MADLPVGRNLHDHIGAAGLSFHINQTFSVVRKRVDLEKVRPIVSLGSFFLFKFVVSINATHITRKLEDFPKNEGIRSPRFHQNNSKHSSPQVIQYVLKKTGPLTLLGGVEGVGFLKTKYNNDSGDWPDAEIHFVSSSPAGDGGATIKKVMGISDEFFDRVYRPHLHKDSFTLYPVLLRPQSRGYVKLYSPDPDDPPLINPRYLTKNRDVLTLVEGRLGSVDVAIDYFL